MILFLQSSSCSLADPGWFLELEFRYHFESQEFRHVCRLVQHRQIEQDYQRMMMPA